MNERDGMAVKGNEKLFIDIIKLLNVNILVRVMESF